MANTPADVISINIGINLVNLDLMRRLAFGPAVHGLVETIRDGHPDTPVLVFSPIFCGIHEDTPGPGAFDRAALTEGRIRFTAAGDPAETAVGKLSLRVIRGEQQRIIHERASTHPARAYLDGLTLSGEGDAAVLPLPDALHPDPAATN